MELTITISCNTDTIMEKVEEARLWLGEKALEDCNMYSPVRTGAMRRDAYFDPVASEIVYPANYASDVYYAEENGYMIHTDKNPMATSHWIEHAVADNRDAWIEGVQEILNGG